MLHYATKDFKFCDDHVKILEILIYQCTRDCFILVENREEVGRTALI
jgi:hypothetical protein